MTISDLDIYQSAKVVIKQYGEDAPIHRTKRASAMLESGDLDGLEVWQRVLRAVAESQETKPNTNER